MNKIVKDELTTLAFAAAGRAGLQYLDTRASPDGIYFNYKGHRFYVNSAMGVLEQKDAAWNATADSLEFARKLSVAFERARR